MKVRQSQDMNKVFLFASFKGKDLLESTGMPSKSSIEFKELMERLATETDYLIIRTNIFDFAFFIYADKRRAEYFTNNIMLALEDITKESEVML